MTATHGNVDREWVIEQCEKHIGVIEEAMNRCEADYAKPFYRMEWSWKRFRYVEVERSWTETSWCYKFYNTEEDWLRLRKIRDLAINSSELYLSPEDMRLVLGKYRKWKDWNASPPKGYYYKETNE